MKGIVKNIPMQNRINPVNDAIPETNTNPNNSKGCFETSIALDLMASIAFRFPNTISGMLKKVKNEIPTEINAPSSLIPE